jgi:ABC-type branched-subunit amino acid transport system ATPase component
MIEIKDLWAGYGGLDVIRGVELRVQRGTVNCIVGPNGAGKSTVLKAISGLLTPRQGSIAVGGRDITRRPPADVLRAGVVQVPQRHGLFTGLTVRQNVLMGGYLIRRQRQRLERRYEELAEIFQPLAERPNVPAGALSGGQRRMVEFARAMMLEPEVVLLDEPTLGLDPNSLKVIRSSIGAMRAASTTILMVEQNVRFGLEVADEATVMNAGKIALSGPAAELVDQPRLIDVFFGSGGQVPAAGGAGR